MELNLQDIVPYPILKGIARKSGDGFKDTTRAGDVVFVINRELPKPHAPGQYLRLGSNSWTASREMFDFTPASLPEIQDHIVGLVEKL